jgi:hypothetical protein
VMCNMIVRNVVEEKTAHPTHKRSINGGDSAPQESPAVFPEVRKGGVSVVEVGEHDDPVVQKHVRDKIDLDERLKASVIGPYGKTCGP